MSEPKVIKFNEKEVKNEEITLVIPDYCYRYEEMLDSMKDAKENSDKVIAQQQVLIDIVSKSDKAEEFKNFIKDIEQSITLQNEQSTKLQMKIELLTALLAKCKDNAVNAETVSMLSMILGVFD